MPIKKERIFRRLCLDEGYSITSLAASASLPKSYVSKTIKDLEAKHIVFGNAKLVPDRRELLREWGALKRRIFAGLRPLTIDILMPDRIREILPSYIASGPFAELLVQGQTPGRPLILYCSETEIEKLLNKALHTATLGRGNVIVYPYDMDIAYGSSIVKGWSIASLPQIAADIIALSTYAEVGFELFDRWRNVSGRLH